MLGRGQDNIVLRILLEQFYKRLSLSFSQQINYNQRIKNSNIPMWLSIRTNIRMLNKLLEKETK